MYKVLGADGKVYGPVSLEQLSQWATQGRLNPQSQVQPDGATQWQPAGAIPEVSAALAAAGFGAPPPVSAPAWAAGAGAQPKTGLAVTSFVLGLLSVPLAFACVGLLTGIPAIICGHLAHRRARRGPAQYGAGGLAIAGWVLGYVSVLLALVLLFGVGLPMSRTMKAFFMGTGPGSATSYGQSLQCVNNLKQIGLAFRTWSLDNHDQLPFNVSTNAGGTLELRALGPDGFDQNAAVHFMVMSNELSMPSLLVCPGDSSRSPAFTFLNLLPANVSYQLRTGPGVASTNPAAVLVVCPVHNNVLLVDGTVQRRPRNAPGQLEAPGK